VPIVTNQAPHTKNWRNIIAESLSRIPVPNFWLTPPVSDVISSSSEQTNAVLATGLAIPML
jgi:hypothetical protein